MDTNIFKNKLEAEKKRLENELSAIGTKATEAKDANTENWEATKTLEVDTADENELADAFEEQSTNEGIVATLEAQLKDVNESLGKIETGTYGVCSVCGEKIEEDRLSANPAARTCKAHMN